MKSAQRDIWRVGVDYHLRIYWHGWKDVLLITNTHMIIYFLDNFA